MRKVYSSRVKPGDLSHELYSLQNSGYTINNVYQDHTKEFGTNKEIEVYIIIYERDE